MKTPKGDFYWIGHRTKYTCPVLMMLSMWYYRALGHDCRWYPEDEDYGAYIAIRQGRDGGYLPRCIFPKWMILTELKIRRVTFHVFALPRITQNYGFAFALKSLWLNMRG